VESGGEGRKEFPCRKGGSGEWSWKDESFLRAKEQTVEENRGGVG
jgi:hypothetical protein